MRVTPQEINANMVAALRSFLEIVKNELEHNSMTQSDLAERVGVSSAFVSAVLSGKKNITLKTMARFSLALGIRVELITSTGECSTCAARWSRSLKWPVDHRWVIS